MEYFVAVFDNDDNDKLGMLKPEETAVADSMTELKKAGWDAEVRGNMGGKSLADLLGSIGQEMTIFHFSGHHGHGLLKMADGKVNAEPLIDFLNGCPKLKLVFINGCSSQNFVDNLTNVPIVIGTRKAIVDAYAKDVSTSFYRSIQLHPDRFGTPEDIHKLFEDARNLADMNASKDAQLSNTLPEGGAGDSGELVPWGGEPEGIYLFKMNKDASDFDNRFLGSVDVDVNKQLWERIQPIEQEIGYGEIGQGEFYKTYPYVFSLMLSGLKPELSVKGGIVRLKEPKDLGDISKLSFDRCVAIFNLHYQLITFLKFSAFSILWTLHNRKIQKLDEMSSGDKELLRNHLSNHYYGSTSVGAEKIDDLAKIYAMIPYDKARDSELVKDPEHEVWVRMKDLVSTEMEGLKSMAELIKSFTTEAAQDNKANWLKAEQFLTDFITKDAFSFLRKLSIWSIYDIYYRQFRYRDEKELVFKRGLFPVATRPVEGVSDTDTMVLSPDDQIDYDVQSVYLVENNNRVLNLTPFYVDMYASDENANKMDICYLEAFRQNVNLNYISLVDEEWHEVGQSKDNNEQKFIYDQVAYFWTLISN